MNNYAIVNKTVAPITQKPHFKSEMVDEGLFGMVVEILNKEDDGWYFVETHYNYKGYIHGKYLLVDNKEALSWKEKANYYIHHSIVDVMKEPKYQSYSVGLLPRGAYVNKTGQEKESWIEIELPGGNKGWVKKPFIKKLVSFDKEKQEEELRKRLVDTAKLYLGVQYRWGGKSPLGIDCSGLCSMAYLLNGIIIYRDAELKEEYMRSISLDEIEKGDLLFFPGHVAMYIGDDRYIHSTSKSHGVVINSLNTEHEDFRKDLLDDIVGIGTIFRNS